jgi:hypothetical protein
MKKNKVDVILRVIMVLCLCACLGLICVLYTHLPQHNTKFNSSDYDTYQTNVHPRYAFEEYDVEKNTISAKGWYVLEDEDSKNCQEMTVYLSTRDSHLFYKMKTTRQDRQDVDTYLRKRVSGEYLHAHVQSGFTATISRKDLPHDTYYFYVYYKSKNYKVMTKLAYKIII